MNGQTVTVELTRERFEALRAVLSQAIRARMVPPSLSESALEASADLDRAALDADPQEGPGLDHDDRTRLHGIATGIELAIKEGLLNPDFAARDARFLRVLATQPCDEPREGR